MYRKHQEVTQIEFDLNHLEAFKGIANVGSSTSIRITSGFPLNGHSIPIKITRKGCSWQFGTDRAALLNTNTAWSLLRAIQKTVEIHYPSILKG